MRGTKKRDDEQSRRTRRRTLLVDLEDDRALVRAHDTEIGGDRYRQRTIAAADGEQIDAVAAPGLGQRRREPRRWNRERPGRRGKTLGQRGSRGCVLRRRRRDDKRREDRGDQQRGSTGGEKKPAPRNREPPGREG